MRKFFACIVVFVCSVSLSHGMERLIFGSGEKVLDQHPYAQHKPTKRDVTVNLDDTLKPTIVADIGDIKIFKKIPSHRRFDQIIFEKTPVVEDCRAHWLIVHTLKGEIPKHGRMSYFKENYYKPLLHLLKPGGALIIQTTRCLQKDFWQILHNQIFNHSKKKLYLKTDDYQEKMQDIYAYYKDVLCGSGFLYPVFDLIYDSNYTEQGLIYLEVKARRPNNKMNFEDKLELISAKYFSSKL